MRKSKELKRIARGVLTGNYGLFILAMIVSSMIPSALLIPFNTMLQNDVIYKHISVQTFATYLIASILVALVSTILQAGQIKLHLNKARNQKAQIGDIFGQFKNRPDRFIIATILLGLLLSLAMIPLIVATVFLTLSSPNFGSIIIIAVIGIASSVMEIYLGLRFSQFIYILADQEDCSAINSLKQSFQLMSGNVGRLFYIGLSFIGITLLSSFSFGIALLWVQPYMVQTQVQFYMDLTGEIDERIETQKRMDEEMGPMMEY
jgi:uncharacterized membrane protein